MLFAACLTCSLLSSRRRKLQPSLRPWLRQSIANGRPEAASPNLQRSPNRLLSPLSPSFCAWCFRRNDHDSFSYCGAYRPRLYPCWASLLFGRGGHRTGQEHEQARVEAGLHPLPGLVGGADCRGADWPGW